MNLSENLYLDFHAHQRMPDDGEAIIKSSFLHKGLVMDKTDRVFFTAGLHPWHADMLNEKEIKEKLEDLIISKKILAIGEAGIDKLKGPTIETQIKTFQLHIEIADKHKMPLIVHSVKAHNEILKLKIDSGSKVPWVIHHFNGSKMQAFDFINHGFYLSVSHHIKNPGSRLFHYFNELPADKVFLETDDYKIDIKNLYAIASAKRKTEINILKKQIIQNLKTILNE